MIGPEEHDYRVCNGFAGTLLRLRLVTKYRSSRYEMSSYVKIVNLNQVYWGEYREKYEIGN